MSMFVTPKVSKINSFINGVLVGNNVPFLISGSAENLEAIDDNDRILKVSSPQEFECHLARIQEEYQS